MDEKLSRSHPGELEWELADRLAREISRRIDLLIEEGKVIPSRAVSGGSGDTDAV